MVAASPPPPSVARQTEPRHRARGRGRPGSSSADGQVLGALLVAAGFAWLLAHAGLVALSWQTVLSALLALLGVGLLLTARGGGGGGLVALGIALTVVLASASSLSTDASFIGAGAGDRTVAPANAAELGEKAELGVGELHVDLRRTSLPEGTIPYRATVGTGELVVLVPTDLPVRVTARAQAGEISILDQPKREGVHVREVYEEPRYSDAERRLDLTVAVVVGTIEVRR